jgi:hypothetical protein
MSLESILAGDAEELALWSGFILDLGFPLFRYAASVSAFSEQPGNVDNLLGDEA